MKGKRNFTLYAAGRFVSLIGTGIQDIALALFVLDLTGSGAMMGLFLIASMVPRLVLVPFAGVFGDAFNRKHIMVWMDYGRGALILFLAFLAFNGMITIPILLVAQLLASVMGAMFGPATSAMLPDLVEEADYTRANSVIGSINSLSLIIGPAAGGIIYGLGGLTFALVFNGISFVGSGFSEMFIKYEGVTKKLKGFKHVITNMKEGIRFILDRRALTILMGFVLVLNFLTNPMFTVVFPYVMRLVIGFSSNQYGLLQSTFLIGILAGNLVIGAFLAKKRAEKLIVPGLLLEMSISMIFVILIFPVSISGLGGASWLMFGILASVFVAMGFFNAYINTPIMTMFQKLIPPDFRSRVFSVLEVMGQGIVPLGIGIVGIMLDIIPAHIVSLILTVPAILLTFIFVFKYSKAVFKELNGE